MLAILWEGSRPRFFLRDKLVVESGVNLCLVKHNPFKCRMNALFNSVLFSNFVQYNLHGSSILCTWWLLHAVAARRLLVVVGHFRSSCSSCCAACRWRVTYRSDFHIFCRHTGQSLLLIWCSLIIHSIMQLWWNLWEQRLVATTQPSPNSSRQMGQQEETAAASRPRRNFSITVLLEEALLPLSPPLSQPLSPPQYCANTSVDDCLIVSVGNIDLTTMDRRVLLLRHCSAVSSSFENTRALT